MARSNDLELRLICLLVFPGAGLGWFGVLLLYHLYFVVAAIWLAELAWSPLWLANFRFGPMEWLWRSLTRWQLQPMRLEQGLGSAKPLEDVG
jgi:uncharacterized protein